MTEAEFALLLELNHAAGRNLLNVIEELTRQYGLHEVILSSAWWYPAHRALPFDENPRYQAASFQRAFVWRDITIRRGLT